MTGWADSTLGEACEIYQPKTISTKEMMSDGAYPVFGANGIIGSYDKFNHEEPQLLVTCRGATCGSVNISLPKSWITGNAMVVRPRKENISIGFLEYFFRGACDFTKVITGSAQPQITRQTFSPVKIKIPPLPEQQRIVAILDEAFAGLAVAAANSEKNQKNAREVFESYLDAAFTKKSLGWEEGNFGDSGLLQIIDGDRGSNYPKKSDFSNEGYCLFLNTKNVRPDGFSFYETMFISEEKDRSLRKGKLKRRDVLLTTRGTIGNIAIYDDSVPYSDVRINSGMLVFRPNEKRLLSEFLFEVLRSSIFKTQVQKNVSGAAQPQLPIGTIVKFSLPVPKDLGVQRQLVEQSKSMLLEIAALESIYRQKLAVIAELKQALLQKAFSGELTKDLRPELEAIGRA